MYYQRRLLTYFFSFFFIVCVEKITDKTRRRHTKETERKEGARKRNDKYIHTHIIIFFSLYSKRAKFTSTYTFLLNFNGLCFFVHNSNTHQFIYYRFFFLSKEETKTCKNPHTHIENRRTKRTSDKRKTIHLLKPCRLASIS
jgi:hypothetical protein